MCMTEEPTLSNDQLFDEGLQLDGFSIEQLDVLGQSCDVSGPHAAVNGLPKDGRSK
jgi:hypothetical protein